jgi:hypothetical protein
VVPALSRFPRQRQPDRACHRNAHPRTVARWRLAVAALVLVGLEQPSAVARLGDVGVGRLTVLRRRS